MDKIMTANDIDQYRIIDLKDIKKKQQLLHSYLNERKESFKSTEFEEEDTYARVYPESIYSNAKSLIVIFVPYLTPAHDFSGNISVYAQGEDYHLWGKDRLRRLADDLKVRYPSNDFYHQMDNGPLNERFFAYISGLGKKGINSMVINEKYGSYGFIGLIITEMEMDPYTTEIDECSKCMICKEKCPGKAINGDYTMDSKLCASYISQTKKELTEDERKVLRLSGNIFGCDICQRYCPDNADKAVTNSNEFINLNCNDKIISNLEYEDLKNISNKEFKKYFGEKAFSWRGKKILLRNLDIIEDE